MNPILQKIEQGIESKVPQESKQRFNAVVLAGEKIMFDENTHKNMELVKNPESRKDPVNTISKGVAGLMWLMFQQSKQTIPYDVLIMSAVVLMCKAIDFAERGLDIQFDNKMIADTTKEMGELMFKRLGITPEQLQEAINKGSDEIKQHQAGPQGMLVQQGA